MMTEPLFSQTFAYRIEADHIKILRCFGVDGQVYVPGQLEGLPVTELGDYVFSTGMAETDWAAFQAQGGRFTDEGWKELPQLCGDGLTKLVLPETMKKVGAYCFYQCDRLHTLACPSSLTDWGRGAFTGCHHVNRLELLVTDETVSCFKEVLSELHEELEVVWQQPDAAGGQSTAAHLLFPEYFEEGVENTPARILVTMVHGSGLYYRNCFQGRRFDFQEYDSRFVYAAAQENTALLVRLVYDRLRYPMQLRIKDRSRYLEYLNSHLQALAHQFFRQKDVDGLEWLCQIIKQGELPVSCLESLIQWTSQADFPEGLAFLMDFRHSQCRTAPVRRRKEL